MTNLHIQSPCFSSTSSRYSNQSDIETHHLPIRTSTPELDSFRALQSTQSGSGNGLTYNFALKAASQATSAVNRMNPVQENSKIWMQPTVFIEPGTSRRVDSTFKNNRASSAYLRSRPKSTVTYNERLRSGWSERSVMSNARPWTTHSMNARKAKSFLRGGSEFKIRPTTPRYMLSKGFHDSNLVEQKQNFIKRLGIKIKQKLTSSFSWNKRPKSEVYDMTNLKSTDLFQNSKKNSHHVHRESFKNYDYGYPQTCGLPEVSVTDQTPGNSEVSWYTQSRERYLDMITNNREDLPITDIGSYSRSCRIDKHKTSDDNKKLNEIDASHYYDPVVSANVTGKNCKPMDDFNDNEKNILPRKTTILQSFSEKRIDHSSIPSLASDRIQSSYPMSPPINMDYSRQPLESHSLFSAVLNNENINESSTVAKSRKSNLSNPQSTWQIKQPFGVRNISICDKENIASSTQPINLKEDRSQNQESDHVSLPPMSINDEIKVWSNEEPFLSTSNLLSPWSHDCNFHNSNHEDKS